MKSITVLLCLALALPGTAQQKKILDHPDFAIWKQIQHVQISNDGAYISYKLVPGEGDPVLMYYFVTSGRTLQFNRGSNAQFTDDNVYAIFKVTPPDDTLKAMRREKVEKEKLPGDTLVILQLTTGTVEKIPDLKSFIVPDRWSGYLVYQVKPGMVSDDTTHHTDAKDRKTRKPSDKTGYPLIVRALASQQEDTLAFVKDIAVSKYGSVVAAVSTGADSIMIPGVYIYQCAHPGWRPVKAGKGTYKHLVWNEQGNRLAFVADLDTTKVQIRPFALYDWKMGQDSATILANNNASLLPDNWIISEYYPLRFSKSGNRLHFGIAPKPLVADTTLLDEEKVDVEVWNYRDPVLYTQQDVQIKSERERSYHCIADLGSGIIRQVADEHLRETRMDRDGNSNYILLMDYQPYLREMSWTGNQLKDVSIYSFSTGRHRSLANAVDGNPNLSPGLQYVYWYQPPDSTWYVAPVEGEAKKVASEIHTWDEQNDIPAFPTSYGRAGWFKDDAAMLIYDRYDIWKVDPNNASAPERLTNGRGQKIRYRYIRLDPEEQSIDPAKPMLLYTFDETTKGSGYAMLDLQTGEVKQLISADMKFNNRPIKARDADEMIFTGESFQQFPDLRITNDWFATSKQISNANPQQKDYQWGTIELYNWTAYDGKKLQGLLVKPDNFDPAKKYPMIVNFYERSSDELYNHRAPYPHRSTINYSFYASRGYVIFSPDVIYDIGHPGESAFNCVVSGTEALIREGFVDPQRIGLQGHSWGGYQIAYLVTRTGIYKCAEAGAPVVNMISAYGGIRWETGLSRMFQYEQEQSRIGGSLWEKPDLYIENSPIFNADKISTPVLILDNDHDGHVPWWQGIEFFTALRRLGKPAWLLNYTGEPHWPLKLQLRKDFNIRLQQFFDYYLKDAPMPKWMRDGVPAVQKGIEQGYELIRD